MLRLPVARTMFVAVAAWRSIRARLGALCRPAAGGASCWLGLSGARERVCSGKRAERRGRSMPQTGPESVRDGRCGCPALHTHVQLHPSREPLLAGPALHARVRSALGSERLHTRPHPRSATSTSKCATAVSGGNSVSLSPVRYVVKGWVGAWLRGRGAAAGCAAACPPPSILRALAP